MAERALVPYGGQDMDVYVQHDTSMNGNSNEANSDNPIDTCTGLLGYLWGCAYLFLCVSRCRLLFGPFGILCTWYIYPLFALLALM